MEQGGEIGAVGGGARTTLTLTAPLPQLYSVCPLQKILRVGWAGGHMDLSRFLNDAICLVWFGS